MCHMSTMAGAIGSADGSSRVFSGDNEDGKEYKRWKVCVTNKLLTLDSKVSTKARGAYVYTLLSGKALECVEHLEPSEYQVENGEQKLFSLLDERFPQKDASDEMSETLTQVFNLKAAEGESLKVWISRATELFDRCSRKCQVTFPEEAKGWILLHRSGLNDEQKAVILARSGGVMKRETVGKAMRSCYPEFTAPKRKMFGAGLIEHDPPMSEEHEDDPLFQEVESFLAEHETLLPGEGDDEDVYEEAEVAEALAVSWKDKRKELSKMQRSRRFGAAQDLKRSYRVEIEELKRKTRCHRCNQIGHWSRDCKQSQKGKGRGSAQNSSAKGSDSGAALVQTVEEHFVAAVQCEDDSHSILRLLKSRRAAREVQFAESCVSKDIQPEIFLVSSPGFGVIDSGCGRTIIGESTLEEFKHMWTARGIEVPPPAREINHFKYGNGERETSETVMKLPVVIAGVTGTIKAAVVKGQAPLLISRSALQTLKAVVDFGNNKMHLFESKATVPLLTNEAGQYIISVVSDLNQETSSESFQEIMMNEVNPKVATQDGSNDVPAAELPDQSSPDDVPSDVNSPEDTTHHEGPTAPLQVWRRNDSFISRAITSGKQGPSWQSVQRRKVVNSETGDVLFDEWISPSRPKKCYHQAIPAEVLHVTTEFHFSPQEKVITAECLPAHCIRQLEAQVKKPVEESKPSVGNKPFLVAEVFCPPRFAPLIHGLDAECKSYDLKTGYDFSQAEVRDSVAEELRTNPPDLLVLCPPCTDEGGWFNLNACHMDPQEYIRRVRRSRMFIRFCCRLYEQQVAAGGQVLLEHPKGSRLWTYPEVQRLIHAHHLLSCHMCRFGLRVPGSDHFIRKATQLLVSHEHMRTLERQCPGKSNPKHACHQTVAGSDKTVGQISAFAGKYTPQFVEAVMETVPRYRDLKKQSLVPSPDWPAHAVQEVLAAKPDLSEEKSDEELLKVIDKVHKNLGHPPVSDLVRILKHAHASGRAARLAHKHVCAFCRAQIRPHVPLPAKTSRPTVFNQCLGIDVKFLHGWQPNQKIKALNLVDQASCYQLVIPFHERETSEVIKRLVAEHWVRIFGPPKEVVIDQARTNLGEYLQSYFDSQGCHVHQIAGEAHWQLGRTENHGGWFARVLDRTMAEFMPSNKTKWEECVLHSPVKNSMIQSYGYTPHQHAFGKNPEVPADLLSEPLHVVPATASLNDDAIARTQAVRTAARKAVVETQDDQALRRAYSARPRLNQQFQPGDLVAYWRCQKYQQGHVILGGQWYSTAVVIGNVGKNYVIAHRKQIFRAAPEQLRPATSEEKTLVTTPNSELLGIKDMIEGGTFRSQQFVDLVPGHYPTMAEPDDATPSIAEADPGVAGSSEASSANGQIDKSPMEPG